MSDAPAHPPSEFTDVIGASAYTLVPVATLKSMRSKGGGPKFYRVGKATIRYTYADLREWMLAHPSAEVLPSNPDLAQGSDGVLRPRAPSGSSAD